jgi:predicted Zn-dependent protease
MNHLQTQRSPRQRLAATLAAIVLVSSIALPAAGQTPLRSGFSLLTPEQDVQIGQQSAAQIDQQMPMVTDPVVTQYVERLGQRLAANAGGPRFTYRFRVTNLSDINAFALPGGFVYVNRGLIENVRNEGELAGVMAHEISHVALRHSSSQITRAYMAQAGVGLLGALFGHGQSGTTTQIVQAVGGFGFNALMLKYSRTAESQADVAGAQAMARAGYDPMDEARFFETLRRQAGGDPGKVARFLSDHPAPADRMARVQQEARLIGTPAASRPVGGLGEVQARLRRLPPAPTTAQVTARSQSAGTP